MQWFFGWLGCFLSLFLYSSAVYGLLHGVLGQTLVFGALYRMFMYHEAYAFQYIALFCAVHASVVTAAVYGLPQSLRSHRWLLAAVLCW